jgi:hypothetical protein
MNQKLFRNPWQGILPLMDSGNTFLVFRIMNAPGSSFIGGTVSGAFFAVVLRINCKATVPTKPAAAPSAMLFQDYSHAYTFPRVEFRFSLCSL